MKPVIALLGFAVFCSAADYQRTVPPGSAIYVDSWHGLDQSLIAAFQTRHLPLQIASSPGNADYTLHCVVIRTSEGVPNPWGGREATFPATYASVWMTSKSGQYVYVWRYVVSKRTVKRGREAVAEAIAAHIQEIVLQRRNR
jgi:hypothetical protein